MQLCVIYFALLQESLVVLILCLVLEILESLYC